MDDAKKKRPVRKRAKHPGVVLLPAQPERRIGARLRFKDPDSGETKWAKLDPKLTVEQRIQEAVIKSKELVRRKLALENGAVRATGTLFGSAIDRYYAANVIKERTKSDFEAATDKLKAWAARTGVKSADDLNRPRLMSFRGWLLKQPKRGVVKKGKRGQREDGSDLRSPITTNSELRRLHVVLGYLRSAGLLPKLSGDDLRDGLKPLKVVHEKRPFLPSKEIQQLLEAAIAHDEAVFAETRKEHKKGGPAKGSTVKYEPIAPFVLFVLLAGVRLNEGISIDRQLVDLSALNHAGAPVGEIHLRGKTVKTGHARDIDLEVSPSLVKLLSAIGVDGSGPVFSFTDTLAASTQKRLRAEFDAPKAFNWQCLRRTCGTFLTCSPGIYGAASAYMSAKRLGHSVTIAERHYVGVVRGIPTTASTLEAAMAIEELAAKIVAQALARA